MKEYPLWHYRRWLPGSHPGLEDWVLPLGIAFYLLIFWLGMLWPSVSPERVLVGLLVSIVFIGLVFRGFWHDDWGVYVYMVAVGSLAYITHPFSMTGLIFLFSPGFELKNRSIGVAVAVQMGMVAGFVGLLWWLESGYFHGLFIAVMLTLVVSRTVADFYFFRYVEQQQALLRTQDEAEHHARRAERERIARDLHDLLGHTLSGIRVKAELAGRLLADSPDRAGQEIQEIEQLARSSLQQVRATVSGYHEGGVALEINAARNLLSSAGMTFRPVTTEAVPPRLESTLAAVMREGVTNIVRHSGATEVRLELTHERHQMRLTLDDNGQGMNGGEVGHGMRGIRSRASSAGGVVSWRQLNPGTRLQLVLPVEDSDYE
ncbi:sensor histidine kinase [Natronospirillum operosum]|nr:sensor histidine kinase [Natronospirillum operosum]